MRSGKQLYEEYAAVCDHALPAWDDQPKTVRDYWDMFAHALTSGKTREG